MLICELKKHIQYVNDKIFMCFHKYHIYITHREITGKVFYVITMLGGGGM